MKAIVLNKDGSYAEKEVESIEKELVIQAFENESTFSCIVTEEQFNAGLKVYKNGYWKYYWVA